MIELVLTIVAVALVGAAAYFYWAGNWDWTFAFGVLAACSFFLSLKYRIKGKMTTTEPNTAEDDDKSQTD